MTAVERLLIHILSSPLYDGPTEYLQRLQQPLFRFFSAAFKRYLCVYIDINVGHLCLFMSFLCHIYVSFIHSYRFNSVCVDINVGVCHIYVFLCHIYVYVDINVGQLCVLVSYLYISCVFCVIFMSLLCVCVDINVGMCHIYVFLCHYLCLI